MDGEFDIVLSFNLLQRNYFSAAQICDGVERLQCALKEGGYLLMGNNESFSVSVKQDGKLIELHRVGDW